MPILIEHIDAIARNRQNHLLYVTFNPIKMSDSDGWEQDPMPQMVCEWLTEHSIPWQHCSYFANENAMCSYEGEIYLDIPFDDKDPQYVEVRKYLENPYGSMRSHR